MVKLKRITHIQSTIKKGRYHDKRGHYLDEKENLHDKKGQFRDKEGSFCNKMTNSVEICKQSDSLNFINVKLKSRQILKWELLECAIY